LASINYNHEQIIIGFYKKEIYAARARDLYINIHLPHEHYKFNFIWTINNIVNCKNKLYSPKKPNKWIPKTYTEQIDIDTKRILSTVIDDNLLLLEKINGSYNRKIKDKINSDCKILEL